MLKLFFSRRSKWTFQSRNSSSLSVDFQKVIRRGKKEKKKEFFFFNNKKRTGQNGSTDSWHHYLRLVVAANTADTSARADGEDMVCSLHEAVTYR